MQAFTGLTGDEEKGGEGRRTWPRPTGGKGATASGQKITDITDLVLLERTPRRSFIFYLCAHGEAEK